MPGKLNPTDPMKKRSFLASLAGLFCVRKAKAAQGPMPEFNSRPMERLRAEPVIGGESIFLHTPTTGTLNSTSQSLTSK